MSRGRKKDLVWDFDYGQYLQVFQQACEELRIDLVPYQARHSGPSIDRASRSRELEEVRKRGGWLTRQSVMRYEKAGRLAATWQKLDADLQMVCKAAEQHLEAIILGRPHPHISLPRWLAGVATSLTFLQGMAVWQERLEQWVFLLVSGKSCMEIHRISPGHPSWRRSVQTSIQGNSLLLCLLLRAPLFLQHGIGPELSEIGNIHGVFLIYLSMNFRRFVWGMPASKPRSRSFVGWISMQFPGL